VAENLAWYREERDRSVAAAFILWSFALIPGGPEKTSRTFAWHYATEQVK